MNNQNNDLYGLKPQKYAFELLFCNHNKSEFAFKIC